MTTTPDHLEQHSSRTPRRRWQAGLAASVLALALLALAACGGSDENVAAAPNDAAAAATGSDMQAFQQCLADNGVEMGAPRSQEGSSDGSQPSMPDQEAMQQAQEACADLMPEGMGQGGPGMGAGGGGNGEMQAYTECLAENGVEVETPGAGRGAPPTGDPGAAAPPEGGSMFGLDTSDPEVAAAVEACSDLEPSMPSGGPGGQAPGADAPSGSDSSDDTTQSS